MVANPNLDTELMTIDQFLDWYPDGYGRYELRRGVVLEMQPTGTHEQVSGFLGIKLSVQIENLNLPYNIPRQVLIKPLSDDQTCYIPDIAVIDNECLKAELLWKKRSIITQGSTVKLAIEVVSINWRNDYGYKLVDYEELGVQEYWIVDYLGLGGKRYIGETKEPVISVYQFVEEEYQLQQFRGEEKIRSSAFPELNLTANQVFAVAT